MGLMISEMLVKEKKGKKVKKKLNEKSKKTVRPFLRMKREKKKV